MKNLMIYVGPTKEFSDEHETLTMMQIDNSFELGWLPKDILLVTDFFWEYRGVKAYLLPDGNYAALDGNRSSKILAINALFRSGFFEEGELYWFHDHDAFQLEKFQEPDLGSSVAVFTDHGWSSKWNAGSFFFTNKAVDLFRDIYSTMMLMGLNEQDSLTHLWESHLVPEPRLLNITYNLGIYHLFSNLKKADKPLLVAHFHPHKPKHLDLFRFLIPDRLVNIFKTYGIR